MDDKTKRYLERREMAERAAAKHASSPEARRAHQELAQLYAASRSGSPQREKSHEEPIAARLTILGKPH